MKNENPNLVNELKSELTILSWNIKMFSGIYGWLQKSAIRSENIIQSLEKSSKYDIILFQEAFSKTSRGEIYNGLKSLYPHQIQPYDKATSIKNNSGLWVISSIPIKLVDELVFSKSKAWDSMALKGARLYSVEKNNKTLYIINTHMQADYKNSYSAVRNSQYMEINNNLILPNLKKEIPFILCGDLNIAKKTDLDKMLKELSLTNGPLSSKIKFTELNRKKDLLDYILIRGNDFTFSLIERRVLNLSVNLFENPLYLSDHYPIEARFIW